VASIVPEAALSEAPVASPRVKKRARKEQLLQQHKLFGKHVLDRISKGIVTDYDKVGIYFTSTR
jgi:hypothetical protein